MTRYSPKERRGRIGSTLSANRRTLSEKALARNTRQKRPTAMESMVHVKLEDDCSEELVRGYFE
jgi:hypothetical protein